jgi:hypothetical protein
MNGDLTLEAAAESRTELAAFRQCYWDGIETRVERLREAGRAVANPFNLHPSVEID